MLIAEEFQISIEFGCMSVLECVLWAVSRRFRSSVEVRQCQLRSPTPKSNAQSLLEWYFRKYLNENLSFGVKMTLRVMRRDLGALQLNTTGNQRTQVSDTTKSASVLTETMGVSGRTAAAGTHLPQTGSDVCHVGPIRHCEPPLTACSNFTLPFTRYCYCRHHYQDKMSWSQL